MAEESKLLISIDARNAEKTAKNLKKVLDDLDDAGDNAGDSIDNLSKKTGDFDKNASKVNMSVTNLAKSVAMVAGAVAGATGALIGMATAYAYNAQEIQNQARLANMGVVEFQRLSIAAKQVGVSSEQLSDQLKDFNEKLGEFVLTGKGEATDAFELLQKQTKMTNKEIKEFALQMQKASGGEAMQMYVNKMKEAGVTTEQLSFLTENMANDFTKLLPIFADNGAAIEAWGTAAERAGAIMDEQAIAKAQELAIQSELLQLQLKGMGNTIMQAVVPALVNIADAFFQDSEQGNTFKQIGDTLNMSLKILASTAIVVGNAFYLVGDAIGAGAASMAAFLRGDFSGAMDIVKQNYSNAVDSVANSMGKIDKIFNNSTAANISKLKINQPKSIGNGVTSGIKEFFAGEEKKTKKARDEGAKRAREAERIAKEISRIEYEYLDGESQKRFKLNEEIEKLQKYGQTQYIQIAKDRFDQEIKLSKMKFDYELTEHKATEQEKLKISYNIKLQEVQADNKLDDEQRARKIEALKEMYAQEKQEIILAQKQRMLSSNEALMTEEQRMIERYKLEREEIEKTASYSPEEKKSILQSSDASFIRGGNGPMDEFFKNSQYKELAKSKLQILKEANLKESEEMEKRYQVALERALKNSEDTLAIDKAYFEARAQMQAEYDKKFSFAKQQDWMSSFQNVSSIVGGVSDSWARLTEAVKDTSGEQSKEYRRMFELQKKFAMISAVVNGALAVSQVWADPSLNFYMKIGASIATGVATAAEVALIQSQQPQGFEVGGYTGNMGTKQVAGVVHGQEYVLNAEATKRVGVGTLDALNNGASIQSMANGQGASSVNNEINLKNINVLDPALVGDYLNTSDGSQTMLNYIRKNKTEVKRMIG